MAIKLSSVGEVISGHTFRGAIPDDENGNFTVVQAKNVNVDGTVERESLTKTTLEKIRSKGIVQDGDVLLSNRGVFRSAIYRGKDANVIAASSLYILRVQNSGVLPEFLVVYLNSPIGQKFLAALNRGTIIKTIPRHSLLGLDVPIPSIQDQRLAISIFQNYHSRIALYEQKAKLQEQVTDRAISLLFPH